jgi:hypothetical protein
MFMNPSLSQELESPTVLEKIDWPCYSPKPHTEMGRQKGKKPKAASQMLIAILSKVIEVKLEYIQNESQKIIEKKSEGDK